MKQTWFDDERLPKCAECGHSYHHHRVGNLVMCYKEGCNCLMYACPCTTKRCKFFKKDGLPRRLR